jgi:hypothetical protein
MEKFLLAAVVAASISIVPFTTQASSNGLTLCSKDYPHQIDVICDGTVSPAPIPASENKTACASLFGSTLLPWSGIQGVIFGGKSSATCVFKDRDFVLGSGLLSIKGDTGKLNNLSIAPKISVFINPNNEQYDPKISVLISRTPD